MEQWIDPETGYHCQIRYLNHITGMVSINKSASDDFSKPDYRTYWHMGNHSFYKELTHKYSKALWRLEEADKVNLEKRRERELRNG